MSTELKREKVNIRELELTLVYEWDDDQWYEPYGGRFCGESDLHKYSAVVDRHWGVLYTEKKWLPIPGAEGIDPEDLPEDFDPLAAIRKGYPEYAKVPDHVIVESINDTDGLEFHAPIPAEGIEGATGLEQYHDRMHLRYFAGHDADEVRWSYTEAMMVQCHELFPGAVTVYAEGDALPGRIMVDSLCGLAPAGSSARDLIDQIDTSPERIIEVIREEFDATVNIMGDLAAVLTKMVAG